MATPFKLRIPPAPPTNVQALAPVEAPDVTLTPTLMAAIVNAVKAGNYIETALGFAKVNKRTMNQWIALGHERPTSIYGTFVMDLRQAWAMSEMRDVGFIDQAIREGEWKAAVWRLSKKFPQRWGDKNSTGGSDDIAEQVNVDSTHLMKAKYQAQLKTLSLEQLDALHGVLVHMHGQSPPAAIPESATG